MSDDKKKDETTPKEPKRGKGSHIRLGLLPPDDPVYRLGLVVGGRKVFPEKQEEAIQKEPKRGKGGFTHLGFVGPDDPVYKGGLLIAGRPFPPKPKKEE